MEFIFFMLGMVVFQLLLTTSHFIFFRQREFGYYGLYTACITYILLIFYVPEYNFLNTLLGLGSSQALARVCWLLAAFCYYRFVRYICETKTNYPRFNRHVIVAEYFLFGFALLDFILIVTASRGLSLYPMFRILNVAIIPFNLYAIIFLITRRDKFINLIVLGTFGLFVFARLAALVILQNASVATLDDTSRFLLFTGFLVQFIFLNAYLVFKAKKTLDASVRLRVEKETEIYQQRVSISNDLHDDVGTALSSIHIRLSTADRQIGENSKTAKEIMRQTSAEIRKVMETMNDIIWAVKKETQHDVSFIARVKDYFYDLLDSQNMAITYKVDTNLESRISSANVRKNLLLITKEAINNSIKYSHGTHITVQLEQCANQLVLRISDDGTGIEDLRKKTGNGLKNIKFRAEQMNGQALVESVPGGGTCVTCQIPLTIISV
jgi:signal transduction histidine kinase